MEGHGVRAFAGASEEDGRDATQIMGDVHEGGVAFGRRVGEHLRARQQDMESGIGIHSAGGEIGGRSQTECVVIGVQETDMKTRTGRLRTETARQLDVQIRGRGYAMRTNGVCVRCRWCACNASTLAEPCRPSELLPRSTCAPSRWHRSMPSGTSCARTSCIRSSC